MKMVQDRSRYLPLILSGLNVWVLLSGWVNEFSLKETSTPSRDCHFACAITFLLLFAACTNRVIYFY